MSGVGYATSDMTLDGETEQIVYELRRRRARGLTAPRLTRRLAEHLMDLPQLRAAFERRFKPTNRTSRRVLVPSKVA